MILGPINYSPELSVFQDFANFPEFSVVALHFII